MKTKILWKWKKNDYKQTKKIKTRRRRKKYKYKTNSKKHKSRLSTRSTSLITTQCVHKSLLNDKYVPYYPSSKKKKKIFLMQKFNSNIKSNDNKKWKQQQHEWYKSQYSFSFLTIYACTILYYTIYIHINK